MSEGNVGEYYGYFVIDFTGENTDMYFKNINEKYMQLEPHSTHKEKADNENP